MLFAGDYFQTNSAQVEVGSSVTLRFTPNDACHNKSNTVKSLTVYRQKDEHICHVSYKTGCNTYSNNCACDKQSQDFSVTWHTDGETQNETLILSIQLQNGEEHSQRIPVKCKLLVSFTVINWFSTPTQSGRSYEGSSNDRLYHEHAYIRKSRVLLVYKPVVK